MLSSLANAGEHHYVSTRHVRGVATSGPITAEKDKKTATEAEQKTVTRSLRIDTPMLLTNRTPCILRQIQGLEEDAPRFYTRTPLSHMTDTEELSRQRPG